VKDNCCPKCGLALAIDVRNVSEETMLQLAIALKALAEEGGKIVFRANTRSKKSSQDFLSADSGGE